MYFRAKYTLKYNNIFYAKYLYSTIQNTSILQQKSTQTLKPLIRKYGVDMTTELNYNGFEISRNVFFVYLVVIIF